MSDDHSYGGGGFSSSGGGGYSDNYSGGGGYGGGGYGGGGNPYDQRDADDSYGGGGYGGGSYGGHGQLEMRSQHNPNAILDECSSIDHALDTLESDLSALRDAHKMYANDDNVANTRRIESQGATLMNAYRALSARVKKVKSSPDSGSPRNAPQVGRVDRRLKKAINDYQRIDSDFRRLVQEMQARQYRIVRPEATDEEVRQACEDPSTQIFQQALLSSSRTQQAQSTLHNVRARHDAIQKIERDMIELAELFQDLDVLVQEQEPLVQNIVQKGEEVNENVTKANDEIGGAIVKARSRNRKKWWCLLICILIVIVIAVVVAVVVVINNQK